MMRRFVKRQDGMELYENGGWVLYEDVRGLIEENKQLREVLTVFNDQCKGEKWYTALHEWAVKQVLKERRE